MKLDTQKRKAASILKTSPKKVKLDPTMSEEIKEAITKTDLRGLIRDGIITKEQDKGISKGRARKHKTQRRKGLRKGSARRKGSANSRLKDKLVWQNKVRIQRKFIKELKEKKMLGVADYRALYRKIKGGYFRSKRHVKLFIDEQEMVKK